MKLYKLTGGTASSARFVAALNMRDALDTYNIGQSTPTDPNVIEEVQSPLMVSRSLATQEGGR